MGPIVRRFPSGKSRSCAVWYGAVASLVLAVQAPCLAGSVKPDGGAQWQFDPERSDIRFELAALRIVPVRGSFDRFGGRVWRDPDDGFLRVEIRIEAESLAMDSERYRDWARSAEFFHVRRYPLIMFRSAPIQWEVLLQGGELAGMLTLRGIERDARFHIIPHDCPSLSASCELRVTGEINRRQFGMRSRRLTLSSQVHLDMRFRAVPVLVTEDQPAMVDHESQRR